MKWSTEPPTEPGWYWVKPVDGERCVKRYSELDIAAYHKAFLRLRKAGWEWAGPIPEPTESDDDV